MIATKEGGRTVRNELQHLLSDGLAFYDEMERRVDELLRRRGAEEMNDVLSRAESSYRELILHARLAHRAIERLAQATSGIGEGRALAPHPEPQRYHIHDGLGR
jgi:hypothetical protein